MMRHLSSLSPKSPSVGGVVVSLPVKLLTFNKYNTIHFTQFRPLSLCHIVTMTKPGKIHCVVYIKSTGVKQRTIIHQRNHILQIFAISLKLLSKKVFDSIGI